MEANSVPPELLTKAFHRDLQLFASNPNHQAALVFPPLNSFSRFCLHSLVKDHYQQLTSFSVGEDKERRTVVCHQAVVAEHALQNAHHTSLGLPKIQSESTSIVQNVENDLTVPSDDNEIKFEERGSSNLGKSKVHRRPDRAVYAPPGARRKPVGQNQMITADSVKESSVRLPKPPPVRALPNLPPFRVEIETILGPVRLLSPKNDYVALESGCVTSNDVVDDDLPNVVEIFDFPEDFKTDDLEDCIHRNLCLTKYYDLKWVDSTHALVIFADSDVAVQACNIQDSSIKFRPFWAASPQALALAKMLNLSTETTKSKSRPGTSTATAKRLLARALGMPAITNS